MKKALSRILLLCMVSTFLLLFFWSNITQLFTNNIQTKIIENFVKNGGTKIEYHWTDQKGNIYHLISESSKELSSNNFLFKDVNFKALLQNGKSMDVEATSATYDRLKNIVFLDGNVILRNSDSIFLKTSKAQIHIAEGYVDGEDYVESIKEDTNITAEGFRIDNNTSELTFKGKPVLRSKK